MEMDSPVVGGGEQGGYHFEGVAQGSLVVGLFCILDTGVFVLKFIEMFTEKGQKFKKGKFKKGNMQKSHRKNITCIEVFFN